MSWHYVQVNNVWGDYYVTSDFSKVVDKGNDMALNDFRAVFLPSVPTESAEHMKNYLKRLEILAKLKVD
ncbi:MULTISPECIES: hypothetical protein [unclassified Nostoc]|uniref:hypothetical protein n=1 Tax=unclassified Nostoc TaxID=2593658 RepID=UPI002626F977|nr:hypothetical protein [Nostoc sp. S13]MDF5735746.1 hypothetical protein [Nostoc sp. S13]